MRLRKSCLLFSIILSAALFPALAKECQLRDPYQGPPLREDEVRLDLPDRNIDATAPMRKELATALAALFQDLAETKTSAGHASIAVWSADHGYWQADFARDGGTPPNTYWWASVGKLLTASLILKRVEEKDLSLEDKLTAWLPDYPYAELITIDQLLSHRAGVFSFNTDKKLNQQRGLKSVETLLAASAAQGADFCPGTNWNYSNTGYVMLSEIAEQLSGSSFADLVRAELAEPLSLPTLAVMLPGEYPEDMALPQGPDAPEASDIASIYGAGALRSSAADMLVFLEAYLKGEIIAPDLRDQALGERYPMYGPTMSYGRGVMVIDVPDTDYPTQWIGHSGGSPHAKALLIYDTARRTYLALVLNTQAPAEAMANAMLKLLDDTAAQP